MTLFRQQAVDHFLRSSDGAVLQVGRLPYRNFCLFIVFFLLCLLAFLRWGRYAQTEVVTGVLIPAGGLFARLIGLQRQRIAAQEQLHRQEVQALDIAIDHAQRQIRLAQVGTANAAESGYRLAVVVEPLAEVYCQAACVRAA